MRFPPGRRPTQIVKVPLVPLVYVMNNKPTHKRKTRTRQIDTHARPHMHAHTDTSTPKHREALLEKPNCRGMSVPSRFLIAH